MVAHLLGSSSEMSSRILSDFAGLGIGSLTPRPDFSVRFFDVERIDQPREAHAPADVYRDSSRAPTAASDSHPSASFEPLPGPGGTRRGSGSWPKSLT